MIHIFFFLRYTFEGLHKHFTFSIIQGFDENKKARKFIFKYWHLKKISI